MLGIPAGAARTGSVFLDVRRDADVSTDRTYDRSCGHRNLPADHGCPGAGARSQVRARFHQPGPACAVVRRARQGIFQGRRPQRDDHAVEGHSGRDPHCCDRRSRTGLYRHSKPGRVRQRRRIGEDRGGELPEAALLHLHAQSGRQRHGAQADGGTRARFEHGLIRAEDLGGIHGNEQGRQQDAEDREHRCRRARADARGRQGAVNRSVPHEASPPFVAQ